jgi:hypothetical protein
LARGQRLFHLGDEQLSPAAAPGEESAAPCHERWEIETALDELKIEWRGVQVVLRRKASNVLRLEL